jgi:RimJ/RimL family protein N-acetyltransferase
MFAMLEQPHYGERAVILKETGEIVGAVGIVPYLDTFNRVAAFKRGPNAPATAEVGLFWAIGPAHQRKGFATEAACALIEYLFTQERLGRIIATTGYENLPSRRVMQKLGMTVQHLEEPQPPDQFVVGVLESSMRVETHKERRNRLLAQDGLGRTPLFYAAEQGLEEEVEEIIFSFRGTGLGPPRLTLITTKDHSGLTAADVAEQNGHREIARLLRSEQARMEYYE